MNSNNKMKALYAIVIPKSSRTFGPQKSSEDTNEERLNDNFRTITSELIKLRNASEGGLNVLSARVKSVEENAVLYPDVYGVISDSIEHNAIILAMPDTIMQMVADNITGYVVDGESQDMTPVQEAISSLVQQQSTNISVEFQRSISSAEGRLDNMESWVRIYGPGNSLGINPGVIIGDSENSSSLKAESSAIFFYVGDDSYAKLANAIVSIDAENKSLNAGSVRADGMVLNKKFDFDVVEANGVNYLHIAGRS
ncbi:MAG: hypothetical protein IJC51_02200 [Eggerthellaceae bacterium]|nr:hypothetical protein [Eggerthellaceae bacterium]